MDSVYYTLLFLFQVETDGIDTVAFSGCGRAVVEYMPQMRAASCTGYFGARHALRIVGSGLNRARQGLVKGRPTGSGIELRIR